MTDIRWGDDMDLFGADTTDDLEDLEQDVMHVLIQDRGSNLDDLDRGLNLDARLSSIEDPSLKRQAEVEVGKDDRVQVATASLVVDPDGTRRLDVTAQFDGAVVQVSRPLGGDT